MHNVCIHVYTYVCIYIYVYIYIYIYICGLIPKPLVKEFLYAEVNRFELVENIGGTCRNVVGARQNVT